MRNDEIDHDATAAAVRILERAKLEIMPYAAWQFLHHASTRLNAELARYYRGPADPEKGDR